MANAVAERMNAGMFQQLQPGAPARLAGRCMQDPTSQRLLVSCPDGGSVPLAVSPGLDVGGSFVELLGNKGNEGELCVRAVSKFPNDDVDLELWNQAIQLAQSPQLRHLFKPEQQNVALPVHSAPMGYMQ
mmetsp:Transcript_14917/g.28002  ORF Transcript_14917/g.28002 Transcript_14917/m.28002 type:complete len:130 (+) Transcript_14917:91-480(+)